MAPNVIHVLEIVEIDQHDRHRRTIRADTLDLTGEEILETAAIEHASQSVDHALTRELAFSVGAYQVASHACEELVHVHRLRQEVVGPELEAGDPILDVATTGNHDHRYARKLRQ